MTKKIKWRLGKLPSPDEVALLLDKGVLTKDEAREILFSLETDEDRDKASLQEEIKFLRELVQRLSNNNRTEIIRQIEYIEMPYRKYGWYQPYHIYCSSDNSSTTTTGYTLTATSGSGMLNVSNTGGSTGLNMVASSYDPEPEFTGIKTF